MPDPVNVYLDVDGVLNAVTFAAKPAWGWPGVGRTVIVAGWPIRYSPPLVDRINTLAALPHVRMHWLTTWEDKAARFLAPALGIAGRDWPVIGDDVHYAPDAARTWWKLLAIQSHLPVGHRAVWIDDDLAWDIEARSWAAESSSLLGITPSIHTGLTPEHMKLVEAWCTRCTPRAVTP